MGFRKNRRGGRGGGNFGGHGGGGGGGAQHQRQQGFNTGEPNGLQPGDDVGNRKSFKPVIVPPDDLGNRRDPEEAEWVPEDNCGNRVDMAPTHELSGVLLDLNSGGKFRRRRPKGVAAPERVGRYFIGGVNPLIATTTPRPFPGKSLDESMNGGIHGTSDVSPSDVSDAVTGPSEGFDGAPDFGPEGEGRGRRRRRGRGSGRDQVDGVAAQEVSERRAQRFFDFEEDDRFDYTLKTTAEQKRKDAEDAVRNVVVEAGRDGTVLARLIEDGDKPKVLVTIDERGPAPSLPPEKRAGNAGEPLFVMGNAALMSLNYLVNKIVNRYPEDRIRLAILPAADERLYLDALAEHQKLRGTRPPNGARPVLRAVEPPRDAPRDGSARDARPPLRAVEPVRDVVDAAPARVIDVPARTVEARAPVVEATARAVEATVRAVEATVRAVEAPAPVVVAAAARAVDAVVDEPVRALEADSTVEERSAKAKPSRKAKSEPPAPVEKAAKSEPVDDKPKARPRRTKPAEASAVEAKKKPVKKPAKKTPEVVRASSPRSKG